MFDIFTHHLAGHRSLYPHRVRYYCPPAVHLMPEKNLELASNNELHFCHFILIMYMYVSL